MVDKLTEIYSLRIPETLKKRVIYESRFDPKLFGLLDEE